jgi:mRNA interferase MazF
MEDGSMHGKSTINRGDIWSVNLEPKEGSEMGKRRPCLVVTNDRANKSSPVITVVAITTVPPRKLYPFMVEVPKTANMPQQSWVNCSFIRSVDKARLGKWYTNLDSATMEKVNKALLVELDINLKEYQSIAG